MGTDVGAFALQIPNIESKSASELISYFAYFIVMVRQEEAATCSEIVSCFELLRIPAYSNVSAYMSKHAKRGKSQKYIKLKNGYSLSRDSQQEIEKTLNKGPAKVETSILLRALMPKVADASERVFLQEAIDCYEIGAKRAAIVMTWLMSIHHLCAFVLSNELAAFNTVLAKNTDKRIKITSVSKIDDFSEIPEGKLIEFLRSANIITNDVRKILDVKLGIRNSAAHPSAISITEVKATDFIIDLVDNIITKY